MRTLFAVILFSFAATAATAGDWIYRTMDAAAPGFDSAVIDGKPEGFFFEPAAIMVTVRVEGGTRDTGNAFPSDWARNVKLVLTDEDGSNLRDAGATLVRQDVERSRAEERVVRHFVLAQFKLKPLTKGRYRVIASYEDQSQTVAPLWVVHGDEAPPIVDWRFQHELEKATTWAEIKRINFARIQNNPRNLAAWLSLAANAQEFAALEETKHYYTEALRVTREIDAPEAKRTAEGIEKVLGLLPRYYGDRDHLVIAVESAGPGFPTTIELRERRTPRVPKEK